MKINSCPVPKAGSKDSQPACYKATQAFTWKVHTGRNQPANTKL